ncbi:hypothetical protein [Afipia clevelandensis]|uniref:hypothetical protein n=1 Tax=Afipia clevelandensis TaxID=1034 RepID=UPI00058B109D|nr:hypothetical protein [Afipia clevelandensis]
MENVATLDKQDSAPDSAACDEIPADPHHLGPATENECADENTDSQCECIAGTDQSSDLLLPAAQRGDRKIRRVVRGLLKPLLAVATAQYAIVTVLAGLTAYAVASGASKLVNESLESVITALKRL